MSESQRIGMERAGHPHVVLLSRDPEVAYIYWEWPGVEANGGEPAILTFSVEDEPGSFKEVERFEVSAPTQGRFVSFGRSGAPHRCDLTWSNQTCQSEVVSAPRREAGDGSAAFVRVAWTSDGLEVEPTEHEHFTHGRFPAATVAKAGSHSASSHSVSKRGE